jgi:adhesin transport system outer membrane protein
MKRKHWTMIVPGAVLLCASPALGVDLQGAVQAALSTNPEIRQAVANKEATKEERKQAEGLWYPRISVEGEAGVRKLRNPTRRSLGIAGDTLHPISGYIVADQLLWNSGGRTAEIKRQASRTDAAATRIEERSEFVALNTSRAYIDYVLQQRLVAIAQDNATFHERLAADLREGVAKGSISIADQQQAEERLQAARAQITEAQEDLDTAAIEFQALTGVPIDSVTMPPDLSAAMPASLPEAEELARQSNPRVQEALADLNTSREEIKTAQAELGPRFNAEASARYGDDIDGFQGRTSDLQARVVMRWKIFDGFANTANVREQKARADQTHARLFEMTRRAEEETRAAWSRLTNQSRLVTELELQSRVADDVLLSYREQFNVGRRSLLDVLDAQNTRYNVQAQAETARMSKVYAQYRVLAATNRLIEALNVQMPVEALANQRAKFHVNPIPPEDRQENSFPYPVMGPPAPNAAMAPAPAAAVEPAPEPASEPAPTGGQ